MRDKDPTYQDLTVESDYHAPITDAYQEWILKKKDTEAEETTAKIPLPDPGHQRARCKDGSWKTIPTPRDRPMTPLTLSKYATIRICQYDDGSGYHIQPKTIEARDWLIKYSDEIQAMDEATFYQFAWTEGLLGQKDGARMYFGAQPVNIDAHGNRRKSKTWTPKVFWSAAIYVFIMWAFGAIIQYSMYQDMYEWDQPENIVLNSIGAGVLFLILGSFVVLPLWGLVYVIISGAKKRRVA